MKVHAKHFVKLWTSIRLKYFCLRFVFHVMEHFSERTRRQLCSIVQDNFLTRTIEHSSFLRSNLFDGSGKIPKMKPIS